jgi:hypothetical protein
MNKELEILSLKLRQPPILETDFKYAVEAELWLTFKVFNIEEYYRPKDIFLQFTKEYKTEFYWETEADLKNDVEEIDFERLSKCFNRQKVGVTFNNDWLIYKENFDVFIYRRFFTWNLITQATIQEIKLLNQGINSHRYTPCSAFQSCLETLNSWST